MVLIRKDRNKDTIIMVLFGYWKGIWIVLCKMISISLLGNAVFAQSDVLFTSEPCADRSPGSFAAVPNDPYHYKQCGPAGFYWILPCAPETYFNADSRTCVPNGSNASNHTAAAYPDEEKEDESEEHQRRIAQTHQSATRMQGSNKNRNYNSVGSGLLVAPVQLQHASPAPTTPENGPVLVTLKLASAAPTTRMPTGKQPVKIVISKNRGKVSPPPVESPGPRDKGPSGQEEVPGDHQPRQSAPVGLPYPYPFAPFASPPGPYPFPGPLPNDLPASGFSPSSSLPNPHGFFLLPPMPLVRPTAEPEPPRSISLVEHCVENGTCASDDEMADVFCPHDTDPTRYFVCSPHPEMSGVWVEQQCPAGLHFLGGRCDRPTRVPTNTVNGRNRVGNRTNGVTKTTAIQGQIREPVLQGAVPYWQPAPNGVQTQHQSEQQSMSQFVYEPQYHQYQRSWEQQPMFAFPAGAQVVEQNATPSPGNPWQYAIVNSAGVVRVQPGPPPEQRVPYAPNGHNSKVAWYVRQPPVAPVPALHKSVPNLENAEAYPTPPPVRLPRPFTLAAFTRQTIDPNVLPDWSAETNFGFQLVTPPSTRQPPHPNGLHVWKNRNDEHHNPERPTVPQQSHFGAQPYDPGFGKHPHTVVGASPVPSDQLSRGALRVLPAIPGSTVASNQEPAASKANIGRPHQIDPEYIFPYGRPVISDARSNSYSHWSPFVYPMAPASPPGSRQSDLINHAPHSPDSNSWYPLIGQRCSSSKTQPFADPANPRTFYMCLAPTESSTGWPVESAEGMWALMECPDDMTFNSAQKACDRSSFNSQKRGGENDRRNR